MQNIEENPKVFILAGFIAILLHCCSLFLSQIYMLCTVKIASCHGLINYIDAKAKCRFNQNLTLKGLCGSCLSVPFYDPIPPHPHREGGEGGEMNHREG